MKEAKFWQEGMDGKRFALCLFRKIWVLLIAAVGSAAGAAVLYLFVTVALAGPPEYAVFSQYRIYFDSEKYGEIQDYYNAYTWGEIMKTDQVVDYVMEALPETITKEQVKASVSVGQMNDIKIMPLTITTQDASLSETIAQAYVYGLDQFGKSIEGLDGMDCWLIEPAKKVERGGKTANAAAAGFLIGGIAAFLVLMIVYLLDDSFYLEEDFAGRYPYPVLGTLTKGRNQAFVTELVANLTRLVPGGTEPVPGSAGGGQNAQEKSGTDGQNTRPALVELAPGLAAEWKACMEDAVGKADEAGETGAAGKAGAAGGRPVAGRVDTKVDVYSWPFSATDAERLRQSPGVILLLPWGRGSGRMCAHVLAQLEKQGIPVTGAALCGAEDGFLRAYYGKNGGRI